MSTSGEPDVEKGFTNVDGQPDSARLVAGMEATSQWPAVGRLRAWEHDRLTTAAGERLLDVGCGMGDMACAYASRGAEVTALDASQTMLDAGRERAQREGVAVDFRIGDATALEFADDTFDACRSERVLQWIPDMHEAVSEVVRVVRPGGRICLIDTDWRTFAIDLPDLELARRVTDVLIDLRGASAMAGGRLLNLCRAEGLTELDCTAHTHVWSEWDPDVEPNPSGFFPLDAVMTQLVDLGLLEPSAATRFVDQVFASARADRFYMSLSMVAVFGHVSG